MQKYVCDICGYVYDPAVGDPDNGVAPGTAFADLPVLICRKIGFARNAASAKMNFHRKLN